MSKKTRSDYLFVGDTYDWESTVDGSQAEVYVFAYASDKDLYICTKRDYDKIIGTYGEGYWIIVRVDGPNKFTELLPDSGSDSSQEPWRG